VVLPFAAMVIAFAVVAMNTHSKAVSITMLVVYPSSDVPVGKVRVTAALLVMTRV
jgi:hypothetical protein